MKILSKKVFNKKTAAAAISAIILASTATAGVVCDAVNRCDSTSHGSLGASVVVQDLEILHLNRLISNCYAAVWDMEIRIPLF